MHFEVLPYAPGSASRAKQFRTEMPLCDPYNLMVFSRKLPAEEEKLPGDSEVQERLSGEVQDHQPDSSTTFEKSFQLRDRVLRRAQSKPPESETPAHKRPADVCRTLLLHGARPCRLMQHGAFLCPTTFFLPCLFQMFLGPGYVAGLCDTPLDPADRVHQLFVWERPFKC